MNALQRYWQQLRGLWAALSPMRRILLGVAALLVVGLSVGVLVYAYKVEYKELYSGLASEEAGAITARLQSLNVPFKLSAGGSTILAPADQVEQLRLTLASEGLASRGGGKGMEIFDEPSLTTTPFVQNVNYSRALQTELARSIMKMDSVAAARVHIATPEPSPFIRDQQPTTASVILKLKPGARLSRPTAQAITSLVSRAVVGLSADQVTVMDTSGRLLSDLHKGDPEGMGNNQLEYREKLEQYLAQKVEDLLSRSIGVGRVHVKVAGDLNTRLVKEKRELFNPNDKVALKESITTSTSTGAAGPRGVAGVSSNNGKGIIAAGPSGGGGGKATEERTETDYTVPRTIQEFEDKLGTIESLHVAATVDLPDGANGKPAITLEDVRDLIKGAVGFKMGRDDIKVVAVKLSNLEALDIPNEDAVRLQSYQSYVVMARDVAFGLSAVLGVFCVLMLLRRLFPSRAAASTKEASPSAPGTETVAASSSSGSASTGEQISAIPGAAEDSVLGEVAAMARDNPAMIASLLSSMMGNASVAQPRVGV